MGADGLYIEVWALARFLAEHQAVAECGENQMGDDAFEGRGKEQLSERVPRIKELFELLLEIILQDLDILCLQKRRVVDVLIIERRPICTCGFFSI